VIDHDATDGLLAGYVLGSLSGDDAVEMDRLLTEHVPDCDHCRATLDAFQGLTGELGMAPAPSAPPETLLPRLHRSLDGGARRRLVGWNPTRLVAAAAAAVVVVGVAGIAITRGGDAPQQVLSQADLAHVKLVKDQPGTQVTPIGSGPASEIVPTNVQELYVAGTDVPAPPDGFTYRLWAVRGTDETWIGDFLPQNGLVALRIAIDPLAVDHLLVTLEPAGSEPSEPGETAWPDAA
jgi:anti-sigma-K factor RskA